MTKYERHIRDLCRLHRIKILYLGRRSYSANIYYKKIYIRRKIKSVKPYVTALHEIGHVLNENPHGFKNLYRDIWNQSRSKKINFTSRYNLKCEIAAWKTALSIAKWWNPTAEKLAVYALLTYISDYNVSHKEDFIMTNRMLNQISKYLLDDKEVIMDIAQMTYRRA
jgi:hypothetical protein